MEKIISILKNHFKWLLPVTFLLILTPFTTTIDLSLSRFIYQTHGQFYNPTLFQMFFKYGEQLGFVIASLTLLLLCLSVLYTPLQKYRSSFLAFLLTLIIGAGLLTNILFKGYWGRPRPKQLVEFGGTHEYRAFYQPHFFPKESQKSFPSGHVAMGFCYLSFCLSFRRLKKLRLFYLTSLFTLLCGCGLMVTRVAQGGHFFSDVICSFILMWLVALAIDSIMAKWGHLVDGDKRHTFLKSS